jgi:hypothetical protein
MTEALRTSVDHLELSSCTDPQVRSVTDSEGSGGRSHLEAVDVRVTLGLHVSLRAFSHPGDAIPVRVQVLEAPRGSVDLPHDGCDCGVAVGALVPSKLRVLQREFPSWISPIPPRYERAHGGLAVLAEI